MWASRILESWWQLATGISSPRIEGIPAILALREKGFNKALPKNRTPLLAAPETTGRGIRGAPPIRLGWIREAEKRAA